MGYAVRQRPRVTAKWVDLRFEKRWRKGSNCEPLRCRLMRNRWVRDAAYADGCFRMSAKACNRLESFGLFAVAALFCTDGAMCFNFARSLLLMCEVSAALRAARRAAMRSAGKACERSN